MACMLELLESCVSEMMKGSDPASNTLWILPESVSSRNHIMKTMQLTKHTHTHTKFFIH